MKQELTDEERELARAALKSWGMECTIIDGCATLPFDAVACLVNLVFEFHGELHKVHAAMEHLREVQIYKHARTACESFSDRYTVDEGLKKAIDKLNERAMREQQQAAAASFHALFGGQKEPGN